MAEITEENFVKLEHKFIRYGHLCFKVADYGTEIYKHDVKMTIDEFWNSFYLISNKFNTFRPNGNKIICYAGRRRSLIDVFLFCRYYYNVDLLSFLKFIDGKIPNHSYCNDIKRYLIYPKGSRDYGRTMEQEFKKSPSFNGFCAQDLFDYAKKH